MKTFLRTMYALAAQVCFASLFYYAFVAGGPSGLRNITYFFIWGLFVPSAIVFVLFSDAKTKEPSLLPLWLLIAFSLGQAGMIAYSGAIGTAVAWTVATFLMYGSMADKRVKP